MESKSNISTYYGISRRSNKRIALYSQIRSQSAVFLLFSIESKCAQLKVYFAIELLFRFAVSIGLLNARGGYRKAFYFVSFLPFAI